MTKINQIKQQIVSDLIPLKPQKIILFGSLSNGRFIDGKSDVDLLIIKNTYQKLSDRFCDARLALSLDYPYDIFVLTQKELDERLKKSFFFREILSKGEVIYEGK